MNDGVQGGKRPAWLRVDVQIALDIELLPWEDLHALGWQQSAGIEEREVMTTRLLRTLWAEGGRRRRQSGRSGAWKTCLQSHTTRVNMTGHLQGCQEQNGLRRVRWVQVITRATAVRGYARKKRCLVRAGGRAAPAMLAPMPATMPRHNAAADGVISVRLKCRMKNDATTAAR